MLTSININFSNNIGTIQQNWKTQLSGNVLPTIDHCYTYFHAYKNNKTTLFVCLRNLTSYYYQTNLNVDKCSRLHSIIFNEHEI